MEAAGLAQRENEARQPAPQAPIHLVDSNPHLIVLDSCHPLILCPNPTPHHEQKQSLGRGSREGLT